MAGALTAAIAAAFSGGAATDPYFEYTTLLLPGSGTNGAQNNTFLDGSTNNFTITRNGNTTQGTFSPFSQTGWGNYFGSTNANIVFASDTAFAIGTGNFSIELSVNFNAWTGNQVLFYQGTSATQQMLLEKTALGNTLRFQDASGTIISYTWTPKIGQWYNIAVVKAGIGSNQTTLYIDGVAVATGTFSSSVSASTIFVGGINYASSYNMQGYISNLRYSNTARTITNPTSFFSSDANTLLLTCRSNRFVDISGTPKTISQINGTTTVVAFSPFNPTASWSAATYGGSGYFDGNTDYLTATSNAAFDFAAGDFTIEAFVYPTTASQLAFVARGETTGFSGFICSTTNFLATTNGSSWDISITFTNALTANAWNHIAVVRNGNVYTAYKNGDANGTTTVSGTIVSGSAALVVGRRSGQTDFSGWMSSLRLVKGRAVYTAAFTPPTAPLGTTSGGTNPPQGTETSLLLNFTNGGIYDATSKNDLETVGNAQISTAISAKWGSGSMAFDGTGDYLVTDNSDSIIGFGSGDWTIEFWLRLNSTGTQVILDGRRSVGDFAPLIYYLSGLKYYTAGGDRISGGTLSTGQWYYISVVKSSGSTRMYIDGSQTGSTYTDGNTYVQQSQRPVIGAEGFSLGSNPLNGYLQDLRITKGYARPTTTPTAAFPTL